MKCSRIILTDRRDTASKQLPKRSCNYGRIYQPPFQNYVSWLNKPHTIYYQDKPILTICNLALPSDVITIVDRGAQSERWIKKRPRLQSAKLKTSNTQPKPIDECVEEAVTPEEEKADSEIMEIQQVMEEYEIDEHVKRLIQQAAEYDLRMSHSTDETEYTENHNDDNDFTKRRHKKTAKPKQKEKPVGKKDSLTIRPKLNRTITLSLSKPPSPETVQVIRVDVTSNYSVEDLAASVDSSRGQRESENWIKLEENQSANSASNRLQKQKSLIRDAKRPGLTRHCQKLAVSGRKINGIP